MLKEYLKRFGSVLIYGSKRAAGYACRALPEPCIIITDTPLTPPERGLVVEAGWLDEVDYAGVAAKVEGLRCTARVMLSMSDHQVLSRRALLRVVAAEAGRLWAVCAALRCTAVFLVPEVSVNGAPVPFMLGAFRSVESVVRVSSDPFRAVALRPRLEPVEGQVKAEDELAWRLVGGVKP